jgi:hypothetical protein
MFLLTLMYPSMPSAGVAAQAPTLYVPAYFLHLALMMAATTG